MMILRMDHVSIAVKDFNNAEKFFTKLLGFIPGGVGQDNNLKYKFKLYSAGDLTRMELISPIADGSFLKNFLDTREGGVHHITFQVDNINSIRLYLEKEKIQYFGFNDRYDDWKELFIHPSIAFGVLIQFAEFNPHEWINESQAVKGGKEWDLIKNGDDIHLLISHPGGGRVDKSFSKEELNSFIDDLVKIRDCL